MEIISEGVVEWREGSGGWPGVGGVGREIGICMQWVSGHELLFFLAWCFTFMWKIATWHGLVLWDLTIWAIFKTTLFLNAKNVGTLASTLLIRTIRSGCSQTIVVTRRFGQVEAEQWKRKPSGLVEKGVFPFACEYQGVWHSGSAVGSEFSRGANLSLASLGPPTGSFLNPLLPFSGPAGNWPFRADPWLVPSHTSTERGGGENKEL